MSCRSGRLALGLGMFVACGGTRAPAGGDVTAEGSSSHLAPSASELAAGSAKPAAANPPSAAPVWRRLTPRGSVGESNVSELALLHGEWVGTGFGAFRTRDDGRTWSDESSQIPKPAIGFRDSLSELIVIGDQLLAVSETRLYRSALGSAWSVVETPVPAGGGGPTRLHLALSSGIVYLTVG